TSAGKPAAATAVASAPAAAKVVSSVGMSMGASVSRSRREQERDERGSGSSGSIHGGRWLRIRLAPRAWALELGQLGPCRRVGGGGGDHVEAAGQLPVGHVATELRLGDQLLDVTAYFLEGTHVRFRVEAAQRLVQAQARLRVGEPREHADLL